MILFFRKYFKFLLLALLIFTPVFSHLNSLPIRIWDESRLAWNSINMMENGNYLVTYFDGKPDMWNTKPPLMIWSQVFFLKIFGIGELPIRLPSALSALFTCIAILVFSMRYMKSFWFGFIAIMVLITSNGYINDHAARTGDYDVMLALFLTTSALFFYSFVERGGKQFLYLTFISLSFAVLTKGIAGLLFVPAMVLFAILRRRLGPMLANRHFYFGLLLFLVLVGSVYLARESINPGYLSAVWNNEMGGRYLAVTEGHEGDAWYYFDLLNKEHFRYWMLFIPIGMLLGWFSRNEKLKRLTTYLTICSFLFLLIISIAKTKLEWYDVPLFPLLSMIVAIALYSFYDWFGDLEQANRNLTTNILPFVFLFLIFINPYKSIVDKTYKPNNPVDREKNPMSYFLKSAVKGKYNTDGDFLVNSGYCPEITFYIKMINNRGGSLTFTEADKLPVGAEVYAERKEDVTRIIQNYYCTIEEDYGGIMKFKLHAKKKVER